MSNFSFLKDDPQFKAFSDAAISAEKILHIDTAICAVNVRRAMEFAVKWMYSVDSDLEYPYDDKLYSLMTSEDFRDIVPEELLIRMEYIRKTGNRAAHNTGKVSYDEAVLCLENLHAFVDFIACCYAENYTTREFDRSLLVKDENATVPPEMKLDMDKLIKENKKLKEELTQRREENISSYNPRQNPSEFMTRKLYIDSMLKDAGWIEGKNWRNEVELRGMPNNAGVGFADYVLYSNDGRPLAVIEAKRTCEAVEKGRYQAKLYADILEKQSGRRPVIFLTNGFDTRIIDGQYPERKVSTIYSKRDLEKLFNLRLQRKSLNDVEINEDIAGRYYQKGAIRAVCDSFDAKNRRKALLVMATGSGKTRTVIALCDVLLRYGWVRNILFLADRTSLVLQAKRSFVNMLPDLSVSNLCEEKDNFSAHCIFSTYQTMMNCIDDAKDNEGKLFTAGHFDLIICDEAHRSIYNKYRDIFNYFDAPLVGLTATPKDEIDKNTYSIFELQNGAPTYGYELSQAVKDGYLVDYMSIETKLKFLEEGIVYDDLSEEDKQAYENTFTDENGELPEKIDSSALNEWLFNEDTIRQVLNVLMTNGLRIDYGKNIGKTIIFAKNHQHAEKIYEVFNKEYPHLPDYAMVIDNYTKYAQKAIDDFSDPKKMPQIAISVDMLDTGIDVIEILNLVFFKKVMSKAKFWQMIGRGTRLCPGLMDGEDKNIFYIFDFGGNFDFFRMGKSKPAQSQMSVQAAIFSLKTQIIFKLQDEAYHTNDLIEFRKNLVNEVVEKVSELNRENFAVKLHLEYVEKYSRKDSFNAMSFEETIIIKEELAPLIYPDADDPKALRFDALMYGIELAYLVGKTYSRAKTDLFKKVSAVASVSNIPEIETQREFINEILHTNYVEEAGINEFEIIRKRLRDLMKYIPHGGDPYDTDFADEIIDISWNESELENDDLVNYKVKAEYYVRENQDNEVIRKLKTNVPLSEDDVKELEKILWGELGSKADYESEYGNKPLGEFVREIVGLDMNAAKEAFSKYLNDASLDSKQIYFVNQIVEYIVQNGVMKDLSILQEPPFTNNGSIIDIFEDLDVWMGIRRIIEEVNRNAAA